MIVVTMIKSYSFCSGTYRHRLTYLTLRLTLTHVAFCHGDWGIIIVSDFSDSLVWVGAFMHVDS